MVQVLEQVVGDPGEDAEIIEDVVDILEVLQAGCLFAFVTTLSTGRHPAAS